MIANQCLRALHLPVRLDCTPPDVIPVFQDQGEIIIIVIIIIIIVVVVVVVLIIIIILLLLLLLLLLSIWFMLIKMGMKISVSMPTPGWVERSIMHVPINPVLNVLSKKSILKWKICQFQAESIIN